MSGWMVEVFPKFRRIVCGVVGVRLNFAATLGNAVFGLTCEAFMVGVRQGT